jgi:transposase
MARPSKRSRRLWDTYSVPGFRPEPTVRGIFGDPNARVITLKRRSKKRRAAVVVASRWAGTTARSGACAIFRAATRGYFLELEVRRIDCRRCGKVKRERLDFLADNPLYTKRFAYYVGRHYRAETIKDVAEELALDWHTVKALDTQYMEAQLEHVGRPGPQVIGRQRGQHHWTVPLVRARDVTYGRQDPEEKLLSVRRSLVVKAYQAKAGPTE